MNNKTPKATYRIWLSPPGLWVLSVNCGSPLPVRKLPGSCAYSNVYGTSFSPVVLFTHPAPISFLSHALDKAVTWCGCCVYFLLYFTLKRGEGLGTYVIKTMILTI